ncbi:MAG TPA: HD domain-containing protein, partial [Gammaproteobacteria bacterium]|nr:HD domain-containing protein [Gammaproteobacteria bacterium]
MVQTKKENQFLHPAQLDVDRWLLTLSAKKAADQQLIRLTIDWIKQHHVTQETLAQGLMMADVLNDLNMDAETMSAAILTPSITALSLDPNTLVPTFSSGLLALVLGVLQMDAIGALQHTQHQRSEQLNSLRRMLLAMVEDVRVVLIKLAQRLYVMRHLRSESRQTQHIIATQTMNIYAPLANRLGVGQMKWELEDLAFRYLEPEAYKQIAQLLDERRIDRELYIQAIVQRLKQELEQDG